MACCESPQVEHRSEIRVVCSTCGFSWDFGLFGKNAKVPRWKPKWYCEDNYDRSWRSKGYDKHEIVGTRRVGKQIDYVVGCPGGRQFCVPTSSKSAYCPDCDRSGNVKDLVRRSNNA
jgi:hypothetical protein